MKLKVGIDFDNTLINHGNSFFQEAKKEIKIIKVRKKNKEEIKKYIIKNYSNELWTKIQGTVYGSLNYSKPFNYSHKILNKLKEEFEFFLVSHKTTYPVIGRKKNLHKISKIWLKKNKFAYIDKSIFKSKNIFFETSIKKKILRIRKIKCDIFIDDLQKILKLLPSNIKKIHFVEKKVKTKYKKMISWKHFLNEIKN